MSLCCHFSSVVVILVVLHLCVLALCLIVVVLLVFCICGRFMTVVLHVVCVSLWLLGVFFGSLVCLCGKVLSDTILCPFFLPFVSLCGHFFVSLLSHVSVIALLS